MSSSPLAFPDSDDVPMEDGGDQQQQQQTPIRPRPHQNLFLTPSVAGNSPLPAASLLARRAIAGTPKKNIPLRTSGGKITFNLAVASSNLHFDSNICLFSPQLSKFLSKATLWKQ